MSNSPLSASPGESPDPIRAAMQLVEGVARPRVVVVIGTRPEVIKLAPVCREFALRGVEFAVVLTGQHDELVNELLGPLEIRDFVDADFRVMQPNQGLSSLAARLLDALGGYLERSRPDAVVVQGDTTSALCGAIAAFHAHIPVAHVEAGLRSGTLADPFPEEMNRQLITRVSRWQFAPTLGAGEHLMHEGIEPATIDVVGNTVVDSLQWVLGRGIGQSAFASEPTRLRVLVTLHRRNTRGARLRLVTEAIRRIAEDFDAEVVLPMHPSPDVRAVVLSVLDGHPLVHTCAPLGYFDFISTLAHADLAISDSGGVQEEAPTLGTPVLVARETTERPEAIAAGCARLVGTDAANIEAATASILSDRTEYVKMTAAENPFGDGHAAERIADRMLADLGADAQFDVVGCDDKEGARWLSI